MGWSWLTLSEDLVPFLWKTGLWSFCLREILCLWQLCCYPLCRCKIHSQRGNPGFAKPVPTSLMHCNLHLHLPPQLMLKHHALMHESSFFSSASFEILCQCSFKLLLLSFSLWNSQKILTNASLQSAFFFFFFSFPVLFRSGRERVVWWYLLVLNHFHKNSLIL